MAEDETKDWKAEAEAALSQLEELKERYEELEQSSREMEEEQDHMISQLEQEKSKFETQARKLDQQLIQLRQRYSTMQNENRDLISDRDLKAAKINDLSILVRELENHNTSLEMSERQARFEISVMQDELENQLIKLCQLEEEVIQKEQLSEALQRVRDEARDLKQEVNVMQKTRSAAHISQSNSAGGATPGAQTDTNTTTTPTAKVHPIKKSVYQTNSGLLHSVPGGGGGTPGGAVSHNPSSRSSALQIVSELLRKVSTLESKLASCRTYSTTATPGLEMISNGGAGDPV